jgi:hypothetical protein
VVEAIVEAGLNELMATRAALDALERALVARARLNGATWTELGPLLALTKQGARARHLAIDPVYAASQQPHEPRSIGEWHAELAAVLQAQGRSIHGGAVDA